MGRQQAYPGFLLSSYPGRPWRSSGEYGTYPCVLVWGLGAQPCGSFSCIPSFKNWSLLSGSQVLSYISASLFS